MLKIKANKRQKYKKAVKYLRKEGILPAVLYGPKTTPQSIEVDLKEFKKIYKQAGESSLVSLQLEGKESPVLIHSIQHNPLTDEIIHVDFYQPILTEEVEVTIPLVFEGVSEAVKDLGGTLVKEIQEVVVKSLPENLPHDIKVNIDVLKTFDDEILIKDLKIPKGVKILRDENDIVCLVIPPKKAEEELEKPIEEKVEEIEKIEREKKEEEEGEE